MNAQQEFSTTGPESIDAVVIGAGFSGMYMLHALRQQGLSVVVLEAGSGVGGTWFWNRYPGARCDVESHFYSYSFSPELEQEWRWSEKFATQPEILRYLEHVADRFDLLSDIRLNTRVAGAELDESTNRWAVRTENGEGWDTQFLISAVGNLSSATTPDIAGLGSFAGRVFHTGTWPRDGVDFADRRVGVIGTGSSGTQAIPEIAKQAAHTTVFQRTPNFSIPAWNRPISDAEDAEIKRVYRDRRERARHTANGTDRVFGTENAVDVPEEVREQEYERRWHEGGGGFVNAYADILSNLESNETAADFVRRKIGSIVADPVKAAILTPVHNPIAAKRISVDTDYFDTFNRDDVTLVDVRATPIERIAEEGIQTSNLLVELDDIVFATGFDAMTGSILAMDIKGRGGLSLGEKWAAGPRTYLGVATSGFPNMFLVTGPGSPSVLSNVVVSIEQHVEWLAETIQYIRKNGLVGVEAELSAEDTWVEHVNEVADQTLLPMANSWYLGANVPGKPRVFMPYVGGVGVYRQRCDEETAQDYPGFRKLL